MLSFVPPLTSSSFSVASSLSAPDSVSDDNCSMSMGEEGGSREVRGSSAVAAGMMGKGWSGMVEGF